MGERVNIQYSVDIEELDGEVARLLCEAYDKINKVSTGLIHPASGTLNLYTISKIDGMRQELMDIDVRLGDAVNIINGFISYRSQVIGQQQIASEANGSIAPVAPNGAPTTDYDSMTEKLMNLQERIQQFKNDDEAVNQG